MYLTVYLYRNILLTNTLCQCVDCKYFFLNTIMILQLALIQCHDSSEFTNKME